MNLDLINEVNLGVAKGTVVEGAVDYNFRGETCEVGLYLAFSFLPAIEYNLSWVDQAVNEGDGLVGRRPWWDASRGDAA